MNSTLTANLGKMACWDFWLFPFVVSTLLIIFAQYSFLGFHTLIELCTIIISFSLVAFAWSTKDVSPNYFLLYLAGGYFWIGFIDLLHTLTYKNVNVIVEGSGNFGVQFWLSARFLEAALLLSAPLLSQHKSNASKVAILYGLLTFVAVLFIFTGYYPIGFVEGQGLTSFKIYSEYGINGVLACSLFVLYKYGAMLTKEEKSFIAVAILLTMCAELAFTFYVSVFGLSNLVGHIFKLFSFWVIFQAVVINNLKKPYATIVANEERLQSLFDSSEVSIWEEDFSELINEIDILKKTGIKNIRKHLKNNLKLAGELAGKVRIVNVNQASLKLFNAETKEEFFDQINKSFGSNAINVFIESVEAIWHKKRYFRSEANYKTITGNEIHTIISYQIPQTKEKETSVPVIIVDITKRKQYEALITYQASYDSLTGLVNRVLFSDRLSHDLELAKRHEEKLTLLFLDLDGFKHVNDSKGHQIGDELLKLVAKRLLASVRKSDTVARLGGDEFAILLSNSSEPTTDKSTLNEENITAQLINKLLHTIKQPYNLGSSKAYISGCIGVSVYPQDGEDAITLLRKADSAMYKAKAKGANNYQFFTSKMDLETQHRAKLESALQIAVQESQFSVVYQPIINLNSNLPSHCEALVRWEHPDLGMVSPADFIPLAEELGLINTIGEFVLDQACEQAKNWLDTPLSPGIAVNLSSKQFIEQDITEKVNAVLNKFDLPPNKLTLEITESLLMQTDYQPLVQLNNLRELGVNLAIDDFGTGYSSLSYLKRFPVNILKIDQSFVAEIPENTESCELVKAIISMAKSLKLNVIAEGVEQDNQKLFLEKLGCQSIQGYLYSKPLPKDEIQHWLSNIEQLK